MFGSKKKNVSSPVISSLIGAGTRVDGNVIFSGGLRVDGDVIGDVIAEDDVNSIVVISQNARVEGCIKVPNAIINGSIIGPVYSTNSLELQANAQITGDVEYTDLEMHAGAAVQGRLTHAQAAKKITERVELSHQNEFS